MTYAVVIEHTDGGGYSAYAPDLPGYGAVASTLEELRRLLAEGIPFHIEGLVEHGCPVPVPTISVEFVEVSPMAVTSSSEVSAVAALGRRRGRAKVTKALAVSGPAATAPVLRSDNIAKR